MLGALVGLGLGCALMRNPPRRRRRRARANPKKAKRRGGRPRGWKAVFLRGQRPRGRYKHTGRMAQGRDLTGRFRTVGGTWVQHDHGNRMAMRVVNEVLREERGRQHLRPGRGRNRRNPELIHAASRLDRPKAKSRTACGMSLLEVYDHSPFAEEATCPACRAVAAADSNWWRPKRSNPKKRMPTVEWRGIVYTLRSASTPIPDFATMDSLRVALWLNKHTRPQGRSRENKLAGLGGVISVKPNPRRRRRNPVVSVKRSKDFKVIGTYDVELSDGTTVQISRDGGSGGGGWWYVEWPGLHFVDRFIGFTKAEALTNLDEKVARLRARRK